MNLFLDAVSKNAYICLFDEKRNIIDEQNFSVYQNESSILPKLIDNFIKKNKLFYKDIENIVVVEWPWSFTGIRTIILVVNTIAFAFPNIYLTWISFFDLFENYPIIKISSKRDIFFQKNKNETIQILKNEEFQALIKQKNIEYVFGDYSDWESLFWINIDEKIFYDNIIKNIIFTNKKSLEALYIKKPSIS